MEKFISLWAAAAVLFALLFCPEPARAGGIDAKTEAIIGDRLVLEGFERLGLPVPDEALQKYVNLVGAAVARELAEPDQPLYFAVIGTETPAAFACPGGVVLIGSALFRLMEDEAELAGVLAHEIANIRGNHLFRSLSPAEQARIDTFTGLLDALARILYDTGLDPEFIIAADKAAITAAFRTGYDPRGLVRVLERLRSPDGEPGQLGSWNSDAPPLSERIRQIGDSISKMGDLSGSAQVRERFQRYRTGIAGK